MNDHHVQINPNGTWPSAKGPAQSFTRSVVITGGTGWVQQWGGERREIRPGDVIWIPPNVKHWHGGFATNRMSHIAITNVLDGKMVDWLELVSDTQYTESSRG